jgi:hypothetical protein
MVLEKMVRTRLTAPTDRPEPATPPFDEDDAAAAEDEAVLLIRLDGLTEVTREGWETVLVTVTMGVEEVVLLDDVRVEVVDVVEVVDEVEGMEEDEEMEDEMTDEERMTDELEDESLAEEDAARGMSIDHDQAADDALEDEATTADETPSLLDVTTAVELEATMAAALEEITAAMVVLAILVVVVVSDSIPGNRFERMSAMPGGKRWCEGGEGRRDEQIGQRFRGKCTPIGNGPRVGFEW